MHMQAIGKPGQDTDRAAIARRIANQRRLREELAALLDTTDTTPNKESARETC